MKKLKSIMFDFMNPSPRELMHAIWWIVLANALATMAMIVILGKLV